VTESSVPVGALSPALAFGGVTVPVLVETILGGGAMTPLSVPTELDPQPDNSCSEKTATRNKRWLRSISLKTSARENGAH
jgi:hypothetical protein